MNYTKMLCDFATKDVARYYLTGIFFDGEHWVSTDGYRLLAVKSALIPITGEAGKVYEAKEFSFGVLKPMEAKYPNWKQLLPAENKRKFTFKMVLPAWFSQLKVKHRQSVPMMGLTETGQWTTERGIASFDLTLLAPLCDGESQVKLHVTDGLSPLAIEPVANPEDWFAVIMPTRVGSHKCEVLVRPAALEVVK